MRDWQKTLWLLLICHSSVSLTYSMMTPLLPLFVGELGVQGEAGVQFWAGVSAAAMGVTAALGSPFWGALADRYGRKPLLLRAAFGLTLVLAGFALSRSLGQFLLFRFLQGVLIGFQPAALALVVDRTPPSHIAWVVGLFQTGAVVGTVAGPVLGTSLAAALGAIRPTFWVLDGIALVISLTVLFWIREHRPVAGGSEPPEPLSAALSPLRESAEVRTMLAVIVVASLSNMALEPLLPLYVPTLPIRPEYAMLYSGLAYSVSGLATAVAAPWMGRRADHLGHRRVLALALAGAAVGYSLQGLAGTGWQLLAARAVTGFSLGGLVPVATAAISTSLPVSRQGRGFGLSYSAFFVGMVLGPLSGGSIAATLGLRWTFLLSATLAALAAAALGFGALRTLTQNRFRQP